MELKVKKVREGAILPTRGDTEAAGIDLYTCEGSTNYTTEVGIQVYRIKPNEKVMIPTGIACEFPKGYFGLMVPRSSVGTKRRLRLTNTVGIIDNSYRGEIMMAFTNDSNEDQYVACGERLAQLILLPYVTYNIVETDTLSDTERGEGGFGSTGR